MGAKTVKLTSYLSERHYLDVSFVGAALLDLYARRQIEASILLRSAEGAGLRPHLLDDKAREPTEQLPVTVTAIDTQDNLDGVLDQTLDLTQQGLVTTEPVLLLHDHVGPATLTSRPGEAIELAVYLNRHDTVFAVPAFEEMCRLLSRRELDGATALLGLDGAARGRRQRPDLGRDSDFPMMVTAVGRADLISSVLPDLGDMLRHPVITLEHVRICKRDGQLISGPGGQTEQETHSPDAWQKLTVHSPENGHPVHRAIARELRSAGLQGVTVHLGVWGFYGGQSSCGHRQTRLRHYAPVITTVTDTAENIALAFTIIDRLTSDQELITLENIQVLRRALVTH